MLSPNEKATLTRYASYRDEAKRLEAKAENLKAEIISLLERENLKKYETKSGKNIVYIEEKFNTQRFNSSILKQNYADIYEKCKEVIPHTPANIRY